MRSTARQIRLLSGLARASAPSALAARLDRELAGERLERIVRGLQILSRLHAPAALESALFDAGSSALEERNAAPGDERRGESQARILRTLDLLQAPSVLDRLVDEELRAPSAHRADRFSGNLERLSAPGVLERRIGSSLRRSNFLRLFAGPVATLAAAGLVVWISVRSGQDSAARREYSFRVVHVSSLDELDPLARTLAETLSGGVASAVPIEAEEDAR
jgi:hypothetical protein